MEGVVRLPSELGITLSNTSITAIHELLVPKSIPNILLTIPLFASIVPIAQKTILL